MIMNFQHFIFVLFTLMVFSFNLSATEPSDVLSDAVLEERARKISSELRCLVCRNENIDSSNAPLAQDLRILVRERLTLGESDEDVLNYVWSRYGDFVLLRPRFSGYTVILWLLGPASFLGGLFLLYLFLFEKRKVIVSNSDISPLSHHEKKELSRILKE